MASRPVPRAVTQESHPFRWSPRYLLRSPADSGASAVNETNALQNKPMSMVQAAVVSKITLRIAPTALPAL
jgi:hypothetical protein